MRYLFVSLAAAFLTLAGTIIILQSVRALAAGQWMEKYPHLGPIHPIQMIIGTMALLFFSVVAMWKIWHR